MVIAIIAILAIVAGVAVVSQVTDQMRREADARLVAQAGAVASSLQETMASASSDIRLARRIDKPSRPRSPTSAIDITSTRSA
jgi:Tfp pilus assembly protein PilE